ncbi:regulatory protein RecX [Cohnella suwonensis]|uniref:Regulatory protein RecX n=1 Tax=Cohnella suwonensis TaxID=696072 RepID=A0ABW0M2R4_9BACL
MFGRRTGAGRGAVDSKGKKPGGRRTQAESNKQTELEAPVISAEVVGMEPHPRKAGMYRITLLATVEELAYEDNGDADDDDDAASGLTSIHAVQAEKVENDWNSEVDALIAGAKAAAALDDMESDTTESAESGEKRVETVVTVHEDTLIGWRLLKGRRLSAEEYGELKREERKEEAYRSALHMLEAKARTTAELTRALKRKGYEADVAAACVERLQARRMVDDAAYARRFAEQRVAGHRKGRMLIRQELLQRGVARAEVDSAIGGLDGGVEQEAANQLAAKKWPSAKGEIRERKMKVMGMLLRRGYSNAIAREAVRLAAEAAALEAADDPYEEWSDGYDASDDVDGAGYPDE